LRFLASVRDCRDFWLVESFYISTSRFAAALLRRISRKIALEFGIERKREFFSLVSEMAGTNSATGKTRP